MKSVVFPETPVDFYQMTQRNLVLWRIDPFARQRLGKHIPAEAYARNNRTSVARQRISKQAFSTIERFCFLRNPCWGVLMKKEGRLRELSKIRSSSGDGILRWLKRNGKKGIRRWQDDFICDLKWHWDCYKSVAWIRLVKMKNPSACVTVNCKVCRSTIARLLPVVPICECIMMQ
jgi:hypothetical protein